MPRDAAAAQCSMFRTEPSLQVLNVDVALLFFGGFEQRGAGMRGCYFHFLLILIFESTHQRRVYHI